MPKHREHAHATTSNEPIAAIVDGMAGFLYPDGRFVPWSEETVAALKQLPSQGACDEIAEQHQDETGERP